MVAAVGTTKVVILARGLGTRMRAKAGEPGLLPEQATAADTGLKAMIPVGRPFLDYMLSAIADAGFADVCVVVGPEHGQVRERYTSEVTPSRIRLHFSVQQRPLGTADAVLAAEEFAGGDSFVVLNSDNYYPVAALELLRPLGEPALVAFERDALVTLSGFPAARAGRFGALEIDDGGYLRRILATPTPAMTAAGAIYASMNCWLFTKEIFAACRAVLPSARGELELPQAVQLALDGGKMRFRALRVRLPVLDMSSRADIAAVADRLKEVEVRL